MSVYITILEQCWKSYQLGNRLLQDCLTILAQELTPSHLLNVKCSFSMINEAGELGTQLHTEHFPFAGTLPSLQLTDTADLHRTPHIIAESS